MIQFLLVGSRREECSVALQQPIRPLKIPFGLDPVLRCDPITYQSFRIATAMSRATGDRSDELRLMLGCRYLT